MQPVKGIRVSLLQHLTSLFMRCTTLLALLLLSSALLSQNREISYLPTILLFILKVAISNAIIAFNSGMNYEIIVIRKVVEKGKFW